MNRQIMQILRGGLAVATALAIALPASAQKSDPMPQVGHTNQDGIDPPPLPPGGLVGSSGLPVIVLAHPVPRPIEPVKRTILPGAPQVTPPGSGIAGLFELPSGFGLFLPPFVLQMPAARVPGWPVPAGGWNVSSP